MEALPQRLILYDGVCVVCNEGMRWILDRDEEMLFHYAPVQGEHAARVRAAHPEIPEDLDSLIYVERVDGRTTVVWHSEAIIRIAEQLPGLGFASWARMIPKPLRDLGYRAFAFVRYRTFGRYDSCRMPTDEEAERMLD